MKSKTTTTKRRTWLFTCYMLAVLLLLISSAPLLHSHHNEGDFLKRGGKSAFTKEADCALCDYLMHIKSEEVAPELDLAMLNPIFYFVTFIFVLVEITGQFSPRNSSNKGPPALLIVTQKA